MVAERIADYCRWQIIFEVLSEVFNMTSSNRPLLRFSSDHFFNITRQCIRVQQVTLTLIASPTESLESLSCYLRFGNIRIRVAIKKFDAGQIFPHQSQSLVMLSSLYAGPALSSLGDRLLPK